MNQFINRSSALSVLLLLLCSFLLTVNCYKPSPEDVKRGFKLYGNKMSAYGSNTTSTCSTWYPGNVYIIGEQTFGYPGVFTGTVFKSSGSNQIRNMQFSLEMRPKISNSLGGAEATVLSVLLVVVPHGYVPQASDIAAQMGGLVPNSIPGSNPSGALNTVDYTSISGPLYNDKIRVLHADTFMVDNRSPSQSSVLKTDWCLEGDIMRKYVDLDNGDSISFLVTYQSQDVSFQNQGFTFNGHFNWQLGYPYMS